MKTNKGNKLQSISDQILVFAFSQAEPKRLRVGYALHGWEKVEWERDPEKRFRQVLQKIIDCFGTYRLPIMFYEENAEVRACVRAACMDDSLKGITIIIHNKSKTRIFEIYKN